MKTWLVRFASLYVFDVVVLLIVGWVLPTVRVGWAVLWASVILTALTIWIKPVLTNVFRSRAAKSATQRTKAGEVVVQAVLVFLVELIVWIAVVWLSGVTVHGFFWGYVLPPLLLLLAWAIYSVVDDRIEARAGELYDRATGAKTDAASPAVAGASGPASPEATAAKRDLDDGLTAEQRKMLDEL